MMRIRTLTRNLAAGLFVIGSVGCEHTSDTVKGAGIGGAIGTGAGLALGAATGNPKTGALVGGLLGSGVGASIGNESDNRKEERREITQAVATAQAQSATKIGVFDVIDLSRQGLGDEVIVNQIRSTNSSFQLTSTDLSSLKQQGVSDRVIVAMQNARPAAVVVASPRPVIYAQPAPPPLIIYSRPHWRHPYCGW